MKVTKEDDWITAKPGPVSDEVASDLIRNDAHQEKEIASILINFGDKWYDESSGLTVAAFIIQGIAEFLEKIDIPLYKEIIMEAYRLLENNQTLTQQYFTSHTSEEIRKFAVECLSTPYTYAVWEKKYILLQTQKMPEENYTRQSYKAVLRFKLRKAKKIIKEVQEWLDNATPEEIQSDDYILNLKVLQEVVKKRNEIAAELGTVTLV